MLTPDFRYIDGPQFALFTLVSAFIVLKVSALPKLFLNSTSNKKTQQGHL